MLFAVILYCLPLPPVQISSNSASTSPEPWKLRYIIACDLAKACIYRQLLRPSMGCLLETLFFPILMASTVLKEILLLASVKLPQLALLGWGVTWSLGALKLYCPIYNRSSGRNRTFGFPAMLESFLRAIYGDSILVTASPLANIVKFCVHLSRTVEIAVHNYMRPRQSVYISSTFASIHGMPS